MSGRETLRTTANELSTRDTSAAKLSGVSHGERTWIMR